ncbi:MAG: PKD domain-containing protein, partial [bacterium]
PGTYHPSVVVTDSLSATGMTNSTLVVDPITPEVTAVSPISPAGLPLGLATLTATVTGTPTDWDWDFGTGADPSTSTAENPEVTLQNPGTYAGSVTVTNGAGTSNFPFEYVVAVPVAPAWLVTRLEQAEGGDPGEKGYISAIVANDRMAVFHRGPTGALRLAHAQVENPSSPADWTLVTVDPDPSVLIGAHSAAVCIDKLCVIYLKNPDFGTPEVWFARATTANPTGPDDWVRYIIDSPSTWSYNWLAIYAQDDGMAIAWRGSDLPQSKPHFGWTNATTTSTSAADWDFHTLPFLSAVGQCAGVYQLSLVEDQLYALFQNTGGSGAFHLLTRTTTFPPTDETDWMDPVRITPGSGVTGTAPASMGVIDDRLTVIYQTGGPFKTNVVLRRADGPTLEESTTWTTVTDLPKPDVTTTVETGLNLVGGRLALITRDFGDGSPSASHQIGVIRQIRVDPAETPASVTWEYAALGPDPVMGDHCRLVVLSSGAMAVACIDKDTSELRVAIAQGPY